MAFRTTLITSLLYLLSNGILSAQPNMNGVPIITNYEHSITKGSEQNWCITQDHRGIIYVGNNNKGVLEYDGVEWRRIPIPRDPIVRSITTGDHGVIYVGAQAEFGYLAPDALGDMQYHSLSDTLDKTLTPFNDVWRTYFSEGKVYFCSSNMIFIYEHKNDELSFLKTHDYSYFSFLIDSTLYVSDFGLGLMQYKADQLVTMPGGEFFREKSITGMVAFDASRLLIGTFYNGVYLFDTSTGSVDPEFVDKELNDYFREGVITYIQTLDNQFVISSLINGIVIMNRSGEATSIISEEEQLIDGNVPSVYYNEQGPLWIANYMGVSKLEPSNPFRVFTESSGIEGFVTDIIEFNEKLFVSTFEGLYYKSSTATGTNFILVPGTQEELRHLHVFKPSSRVELLLASSEEQTFVIDQRMNISVLKHLVSNPPEDLTDQFEYSGKYLVQDPKHPNRIYTGRLKYTYKCSNKSLSKVFHCIIRNR